MVSKSNSSVITTRRNLPAAIELRRSNGTREISYLHKDHLGSIDTISDANGDIKQKLYFDAWGKKQVINTGNYAANLGSFSTITLAQLLDITPRGFTGHESVDHADIIHMNGRIYDPTLGRFLQADPFVQAPGSSQSYNRYAYVFNNPLTYTDPSGYSAWTKFRDKFLKPIAAIAITVWSGGLALGASSFWSGMEIAAAGGAAAGYVATGSLKGALTGAFSSAAFFGVGSYFQSIANANNAIEGLSTLENGLTTAQFAGKIASHAITGGVMSDLNGGKFGHGFFAAGVTQAFSSQIDKIGGMINSATSPTYYSLGNRIARITTSAVLGGTVSQVTGGKFANGAVTAAFSRGFNDEAHQNRGIKRYADRIWDRATRYSDQAIGFYNGNAGTINTVLTVASLATGVGAFAAIGVNSLRIYYALSTTSLVTGIGANAFLPTTAGTVGNLTDATMAAAASRFAVIPITLIL